MTQDVVFQAANAEQQEQFGACVAIALQGQGVVYLQGELGAGKTTLTRGILRQYGYQGAVKSPTYTLVESYELPLVTVYHFDLYRLVDSEELELMGIRDYCRDDTLALIEWPERGHPFLPSADILITIDYSSISAEAGMMATEGRQIVVQANNDKGQAVLKRLREALCNF